MMVGRLMGFPLKLNEGGRGGGGAQKWGNTLLSVAIISSVVCSSQISLSSNAVSCWRWLSEIEGRKGILEKQGKKGFSGLNDPSPF